MEEIKNEEAMLAVEAKVKKAYASGINWIWFVEYEDAGEGKVKLLYHYRVHRGEEMPEEAFKHAFNIIEKGRDKYGNLPSGYKIGDPRIADKLVLDNDYDNPFEVVNPRDIFSYQRPRKKRSKNKK